MILMGTHEWFQMANTFLLDSMTFAISAAWWIVAWVILGFLGLFVLALVVALIGSVILVIVKLLAPSLLDETVQDANQTD